MPVNLLRLLSTDRIDSVRAASLKNPGISPEILLAMSKDKRERRLFWLRMKIAAHPMTPIEALLHLREDRNRKVRSAVVSNPQTTVEMLFVFAAESDRDVLTAVAQNPKTPPALLQRVAENHGHPWICAALAQNPNTPLEILTSFVIHKDGDVREALVKNPELPTELLRKLKGDTNPTVRELVRVRLQTLRAMELQLEFNRPDE